MTAPTMCAARRPLPRFARARPTKRPSFGFAGCATRRSSKSRCRRAHAVYIPRIVVTSGEPAGIGPDACVALAQDDWRADLVVAADASLMTVGGRGARACARGRALRPLRPAHAASAGRSQGAAYPDGAARDRGRARPAQCGLRDRDAGSRLRWVHERRVRRHGHGARAEEHAHGCGLRSSRDIPNTSRRGRVRPCR